jgi:transcriptional regulator with XRE-family HTH domain
MRILNDNAPVFEKIRFYRTKRNMKCDTLASLIGMSRFAVMRYESGETEPLLQDLKNIASALEIEADKLFDDYYRFLDYPYSKKIKSIRKENNLLQRELGNILGISRRAVELWEHGATKVTREMWKNLKLLKLL